MITEIRKTKRRITTFYNCIHRCWITLHAWKWLSGVTRMHYLKVLIILDCLTYYAYLFYSFLYICKYLSFSFPLRFLYFLFYQFLTFIRYFFPHSHIYFFYLFSTIFLTFIFPSFHLSSIFKSISFCLFGDPCFLLSFLFFCFPCFCMGHDEVNMSFIKDIGFSVVEHKAF